MPNLINESLQFCDHTDKREDFENFLQSISETDYYKYSSKHFKITLIDYRKTKEHYKELIIEFEEKFKNCLDANFLIETELKKFKEFLDTDFFYTRKNFREKGFVWITTGKVILVEDFFLIKDFLYYPKFPLDIEGLEFCWNSAYHDLEQAAKGGAEGLYVQFLKEKKIEINTPKLENINEPLSETIKTNNQKLKWKGTPSQFGFIIDLLIQGGYLEKPTSSFAKDANFYLQFFDIETTNTTLAKELSEGTNSLATKNRNRITIPHKDKLD